MASQCVMSVFWPSVAYCVYSYRFLHVDGNSCSNRSIMKMPGLPLIHFSACHHSATAATSATLFSPSSFIYIYISFLVSQTYPSPSPCIIDPNPWQSQCPFLLLSLPRYVLTMPEWVLCVHVQWICCICKLPSELSFYSWRALGRLQRERKR